MSGVFFSRVCASLFGVGFSPIMPGTAGSLVTLLVAWFFFDASWLPLLVAAAIVFFVGLLVTHIATDGQGDPSWVVIDESAGMLLALVAVPHTLLAFAIAFILFRFFDIYKPLGINALQRLPGAWGVMLDDIAAGLAAAVLAHGIFYIMPF